MSLSCIHCGKRFIFFDQNFCPDCLSPQDPERLDVNPRYYETCEIMYRKAGKGPGPKSILKFYALATGRGTYIAGESSGFVSLYDEPIQNDEQIDTLHSFVGDLYGVGWQDLPRGKYWYSRRFRRRLEKD